MKGDSSPRQSRDSVARQVIDTFGKAYSNKDFFRDRRQEAGAVAVEFALVLPIFVTLVFGIFEFGRAFNIQVSLSEAARESARYVAIHASEAGFNVSAAQNAGVAAAPTVPLVASDVVISYSSGSGCALNTNVISTVKYSTGFLTGFEKLIGASQPFTLKGVGVMRCGG